jgi:cell division protein FtsB
MRDPEFHDRADLPPVSREEDSKPRANLWLRLSRGMEVVIYVLLILVVYRLFGPEWQRQEELGAELALLEKIEATTDERVGRLRQEFRLLKTDKDFLEVAARDRLGLQREGEYVVRIEREEDGAKARFEAPVGESAGALP